MRNTSYVVVVVFAVHRHWLGRVCIRYELRGKPERSRGGSMRCATVFSCFEQWLITPFVSEWCVSRVLFIIHVMVPVVFAAVDTKEKYKRNKGLHHYVHCTPGTKDKMSVVCGTVGIETMTMTSLTRFWRQEKSWKEVHCSFLWA